MRVHEGVIADTFAYAEQMCALENMRIWKDDETNGVMAMLHYTAHFRDGYMAFHRMSDPIPWPTTLTPLILRHSHKVNNSELRP